MNFIMRAPLCCARACGARIHFYRCLDGTTEVVP